MTVYAVGGDRDDLVLAELEGVPGVVDERRDVGAEEVLAVAETRRRAGSCGGRPTTTPGLSACTASRVNAPSSRCTTLRIAVGEVAHPVVLAADELGGDLGVGLGAELDALGEQLLLERVEVLDDAVVDEGEPAVVAAAVRVRVAVGGAAVRRPAGVPDAGARRRRAGAPRGAERRFSSLPARFSDVMPSVGDQGDAGRVVAAVLEPGQALHHDLEGRVIHGRPTYPTIPHMRPA